MQSGYLEALLELLEALVDLLPLSPLLVALLETASNRQTGTLVATDTPNARNGLLQTDNTPARDELLALANLELQVAHLLDFLLRDALGEAVVEEVEETDNNAREAACQSVNGGNAADCKDWKKVLTQTGEDAEVLVIDVWRGGDQRLVVNNAVRELGADNVGVRGELLECRGRDVQVVGDARVVVADDLLVLSTLTFGAKLIQSKHTS